MERIISKRAIKTRIKKAPQNKPYSSADLKSVCCGPILSLV